MTNKKITVFTSPNCPYCDQLKNYLKEKKISFSEVDLAKKPEMAEELVKKTNQMGVPAMIIRQGSKEEIIVGFDRDRIENKLRPSL